MHSNRISRARLGGSRPAAATPKKPVTDVYNGVSVTDDYRWLENYSDPAVRTWTEGENGYARKYLDALPMRAAISEELKKLYSQPLPAIFLAARRRWSAVRAEGSTPPRSSRS